MRMLCKCGYFITDAIVPNRTNLRLFSKLPLPYNDSLKDNESISVLHCECCHRFHIFSSSNYYVYWLDKLIPSLQGVEPLPMWHEGTYITNDYGDVYPVALTNENKQLLLKYDDGFAIFMMESIMEDNQLIYHMDHADTIIYDKSKTDMSLSASRIRCLCGWLINLQIIDDGSIINLYDSISWAARVKYEFGELDSFSPLRGLRCEKCGRIMLPSDRKKVY